MQYTLFLAAAIIAVLAVSIASFSGLQATPRLAQNDFCPRTDTRTLSGLGYASKSITFSSLHDYTAFQSEWKKPNHGAYSRDVEDLKFAATSECMDEYHQARTEAASQCYMLGTLCGKVGTAANPCLFSPYAETPGGLCSDPECRFADYGPPSEEKGTEGAVDIQCVSSTKPTGTATCSCNPTYKVIDLSKFAEQVIRNAEGQPPGTTTKPQSPGSTTKP